MVVVGVSGIVELNFQQWFEHHRASDKFIIRVLDILALPQRQVMHNRAAFTGAFLGTVVDTPVEMQRLVPGVVCTVPEPWRAAVAVYRQSSTSLLWRRGNPSDGSLL